jgi:hypothetical protein
VAKSRLHQLSELGQSVWIDQITREWLQDGTLRRLMDEDAVVGVTSNPTIFQKAISSGDAYDVQLKEVLEWQEDPKEAFYHLAVRDIQDACDTLRAVWEDGDGKDGYVSMEVDPNLAYDREATIQEAIRLHEWIDRPNLFVKIPATEDGLGAIEECIAQGRSINVTLIFGLDRYRAVAEAYIRGLERLVEGVATRTRLPPWPASSSRGWIPRPTGASRRSGARRRERCAGSSRWRMRSWPTPRGRRSSPATAGMRSPRGAPRLSGASGPPPPRRTPSTATSSTSRS